MPGGSVGLRGGGSGLVWGLPLDCTNLPTGLVDAACGSDHCSESSRRSHYAFVPAPDATGALLLACRPSQKRSCAGPKLHSGRPGASKRLFLKAASPQARKRESFAAPAAGNQIAILSVRTPGAQIQGTAAAARAHEEPRNITAGQTQACGAKRRASEGAAASPSTRDAQKQK